MIVSKGQLSGEFQGFNDQDTIFEFYGGRKWRRAFDVDLELIDCSDNPLVTARDLLPCPELKPRSTVKLLASFRLSSPLRYQVKLRWTTEGGGGESEVFWVSQG